MFMIPLGEGRVPATRLLRSLRNLVAITPMAGRWPRQWRKHQQMPQLCSRWLQKPEGHCGKGRQRLVCDVSIVTCPATGHLPSAASRTPDMDLHVLKILALGGAAGV